ncbi:MAG TPA: hypothetical protein VGP82_16315 [Ktedonobacterales bacterium]|nr:hypothetical protein [Ktedonobacterales bacterium]
MLSWPNFDRQQQAVEEGRRQTRQQAERHPYYPDDPRNRRRTARMAIPGPIVLGLLVLLVVIASIVGYLLLLNR